MTTSCFSNVSTGKYKVLFTGGSGLLGREVKKFRPVWLYPSHSEFDVATIKGLGGDFAEVGTIVHAAAIASVSIAGSLPVDAIYTNIIGTANMTLLAMSHGIRLIYISTDYVFRGLVGNYLPGHSVLPVNKYAWSKLGGECSVRMYDNALIVRGSFSASPFPHDVAFEDQYTTKVTVTEFARRLIEIIEQKPLKRGVAHIAGKRQTVLEYARSISPGKKISPVKREDAQFEIPCDTSLFDEDCEQCG